MKFEKFEEIVKSKYPKAEIFAHGVFSGNKVNVAIVFEPHTRVYKYNGTYCEVLNRLGIKAIYRHDLDAHIKTLEMLKNMNGQESFFGMVIDNTQEISRFEKDLKDYQENYIIV